MGRYILRRLLISVPVLFGITLLVYVLINMAPGDPVDMMVPFLQDSTVSEAWKEQMRERLGLNAPLPVRYILWLKEVASGNLGYSYMRGQSTLKLIGHHLRATLELTVSAYLISLIIGVSIGIVSALKQYSLLDYAVTVLSLASLSVPGFFLALLFIYIFALRLDILPTSGMQTLGQPFSLKDHLLHLAMPAIVLGTELSATLARYTRSSLLEVRGEDYVTTARAKGLRKSAVLFRHTLRNSLLPVITILGVRLPRLFSGAVIIEQIFVWPGIGLLSIRAVIERDYPVLMGVSLIVAVLVVLSNLITDIAYAFVDPRIRYD
jgi:peptide/nickel transport system permease protein